ncbi:hypothetical protein [Agromyces sp. SYSU T0242]|uniref:hypothetical protein n=1 Tax=Agromyces litoreus TaxID=3158561 RepID=UPI0033915A23
MSEDAAREAAPPHPARTAYVVLSHAHPEQVERLVRAILASSPGAFVVVAHDSRREPPPTSPEGARVRVFEHGLATDWGSWELVEATLRAFELAREVADAELVVLVSGQDYPVRPLEAWESEVLATGSWVGRSEELRYTPHWGRRRGEGADALTRYTHRWFQTPLARRRVRVPGRLGSLLRRLRGAVALRMEPVLSVRVVTRGRGVMWGVRRPTPFSDARPCHLGSQWLAVPRSLLDPLLDEDLAPGSRLRRLYRHSVIPDESALVTPLSWRAAPAPLPPVTHVTWDVARDQPTVLGMHDLDVLVRSGSAFARKVDPVAGAELMDELDRRTRPAR